MDKYCIICHKKISSIKSNRQKCCSKCIPINNRNLLNKAKKRWYKKNKSRWKLYKENFKIKYPLRYKAQYLAYNNIKIPRNEICFICKKNKAKERHHEDYKKPLEVKFVCKKCHRKCGMI